LQGCQKALTGEFDPGRLLLYPELQRGQVIRAYRQPERLPNRRLVRIGATAPTSLHLQNWRLIAARSPEAKARLRPIAWDQPAIKQLRPITEADRDRDVDKFLLTEGCECHPICLVGRTGLGFACQRLGPG
jgi:Nitroreductase family